MKTDELIPRLHLDKVPGKLLMVTFHGSHLYGVNTPESDVDVKGVYMPSIKDLLLGKYEKQVRFSTGNDESKNSSEDVDEVYFALPEFVRLCLQGDTVAIDMLHSPVMPPGQETSNYYGIFQTSYIWEDLYNNKDMFYTKSMKSFIGYARKQAAKYGVKGSRLAVAGELIAKIKYISDHHLDGKPIKLGEIMHSFPVGEHSKIITENGSDWYEIFGRKYQDTVRISVFRDSINAIYNSYGHRAQLAKENKGIDWKAISHALRAAYQFKSILERQDILYPLIHRGTILDIKQGNWDFTTQVQPLLELTIADIEKLVQESNLPEDCDVVFWEDWLYHTILNYHKEHLTCLS